MKKRRILFITLLSVLFVVCGCGKKEKNVISVTGGEVKSGEEITVYLRAADEIPVAAYGFNVYYNTEQLTFKECGKASDFEKAWNGMEVSNDSAIEEGKNSVIFAGVNTNADETFYEGDLYYITFTATGEAGEEAELTLDVTALEDLEGKDYLENFTMDNGVIKIK